MFRSTVMKRLDKDRVLHQLIHTMNEILPEEKAGPLLNPGRLDA
jgi:hypothetical protein